MTHPVMEYARRARTVCRDLATTTTNEKNAALRAIASALEAHSGEICAANAKDMDAGRAGGMSEGLLDRLLLTPERVQAIADAVREVAALPDPVGEVISGSTLANGLRLRKVRVPMGVVGMIYEARPNVTVDAAVLALKSGNAVILRGGSAALHSNEALVAVMRQAIGGLGLPADLIQTIDAYGREGAQELMRARGLVDVLIPRGGANLIQEVVRTAIVPVIETGVGNCHVYVDRSADLAQAVSIVVNSKTHRVGVCNAAETLLIDSACAPEYAPVILEALAERGVVFHYAPEIAQYLPADTAAVPATDDDWDTEYLALDLAVRCVEGVDDAVDHIRRHSTGHTEAICAQDYAAIQRFVRGVDAAAVMVNASTRFTDGGQFGLGAEIGISTQKLHARGPMGLAELTTSTWIVEGEGHVR